MVNSTTQPVPACPYVGLQPYTEAEREYFFQVDHRRVAERADLIDALKARQACEDFRMPAIVWDFSSDAHGWEAWGKLDDLVIRDRALFSRSHGNDPFWLARRSMWHRLEWASPD